jgi:hypothetical protein
MSLVPQPSEGDEFERRLREWLLDSAEQLPGSVRSRLTQARHAALEARGARQPFLTRPWMPAGALAAVVLALFVVLVPHGSGSLLHPGANAPIEDIELLTDTDLPLNGDQEMDNDFYEWAANEAAGTATTAVGS